MISDSKTGSGFLPCFASQGFAWFGSPDFSTNRWNPLGQTTNQVLYGIKGIKKVGDDGIRNSQVLQLVV